MFQWSLTHQPKQCFPQFFFSKKFHPTSENYPFFEVPNNDTLVGGFNPFEKY